METKLTELYKKCGQSPWLDNINREYFESGRLRELIEQGIRGLTSNPTIFAKAIEGSTLYDAELTELIKSGLSIEQAYWELTEADIRRAADLLKPVYEESEGKDGFVSLEVSPKLAHDKTKTVDQAKELFNNLNIENLFIKIPATLEGLEAIEETLSEGINVNVTLIFSLDRYRSVIDAFQSGLERFKEKGGDISKCHSVASFFVSRLDTKIDPILERNNNPELSSLAGKVALYQAKLAYNLFLESTNTSRMQNLLNARANLQRPLFASTSTKNPNYPDLLYVNNLIGKHSINTMPESTIMAFLDHGQVKETIGEELPEAKNAQEILSQNGIDLAKLCQELEQEGVSSFAASFDEVLKVLDKKATNLS